MSLCDFLLNEFLESEIERLRHYQYDETSLSIGILNGFREAFKRAAELTNRPDLLKMRAPYEYGELKPGRPKKQLDSTADRS